MEPWTAICCGSLDWIGLRFILIRSGQVRIRPYNTHTHSHTHILYIAPSRERWTRTNWQSCALLVEQLLANISWVYVASMSDQIIICETDWARVRSSALGCVLWDEESARNSWVYVRFGRDAVAPVLCEALRKATRWKSRFCVPKK